MVAKMTRGRREPPGHTHHVIPAQNPPLIPAQNPPLIPAHAGIQLLWFRTIWFPAFAGMTNGGKDDEGQERAAWAGLSN